MSNSSLTVAVHGVTGPQGAAVARALLTTGAHVRGIARQGAAPDGVEPVAADLLDADALTRAYTGADAVVVHLPTVFAPDTALAQADAVLHAVRRAGVRRLVV
ncbi:MAG TPA: NAD(P)H-binding protein, partial [Kineosporiaceae bacterium]|nr:NAD(P)H-binding protein [Kineosporiaceae bacterium]